MSESATELYSLKKRKKKKCKCDISNMFIFAGIIVYFGSNMGINLFNKWMFRFEVEKFIRHGA